MTILIALLLALGGITIQDDGSNQKDQSSITTEDVESEDGQSIVNVDLDGL